MRQLAPDPLDRVKRWEAPGGRPVLKAYRDGAGKWTIGFGTTQGVTAGMVITEAQAEAMLQRDIAAACMCVEQAVIVPLTDNQFGALVSLVYNIGRTAFLNSTLLKKLNAGDFEAVPMQFMRWTKITDPETGKKVVSNGLVNRRSAEVGLWSAGAFVPSADVDVVSPQRTASAIARTPEVIGAVVGGGAGITAVGAVLNESASSLRAVSDGSAIFSMIVLLVVLVGLGLTVYGVIRRGRA